MPIRWDGLDVGRTIDHTECRLVFCEAKLDHREALLNDRQAKLDARENRLNGIQNLLATRNDRSEIHEIEPPNNPVAQSSTRPKRPISSVEESDNEQPQPRKPRQAEVPSSFSSPAGTAAAKARRSINSQAREERYKVRGSTKQRRLQSGVHRSPCLGVDDPPSVPTPSMPARPVSNCNPIGVPARSPSPAPRDSVPPAAAPLRERCWSPDPTRPSMRGVRYIPGITFTPAVLTNPFDLRLYFKMRARVKERYGGDWSRYWRNEPVKRTGASRSQRQTQLITTPAKIVRALSPQPVPTNRRQSRSPNVIEGALEGNIEE